LKPAGYLSDPVPAVEANLAAIVALARVEFQLVDSLPTRDSPAAITDCGKVMLHIEIDREAERARLTKERDRIEAEVAKSKAKLSNPSFVERAKPEVVEQERTRLTDFETKLGDLRDQLAKNA
jgi:valyl-tRNA synthetase